MDHHQNSRKGPATTIIRDLPMKIPHITSSLFLVATLATGMQVTAATSWGAEGESMMQRIEHIGSTIFGRRGGYIHPYCSLSGMYQDNVYNSSADKRSDFATTLIPGIWVAFPGTRKEIIHVEAANQSPGGLSFGYAPDREFRRMQAYLNYSAHLTRYNSESQADTTDHNLQGYFQYNLRGGLRFELLEVYNDSHDSWSQATPGLRDDYKSNITGGRVTYNLGKKISLLGGYRLFTLDYDDDRNAYRDREDQSITAMVSYRFSPKSSFFLEYDFVDISYDSDPDADSREHHYFAGYQWKITGKTTGQFKIGYANKDFAGPGNDSSSDLTLQTSMSYKFTPKTSITIHAMRQYEETDQSDNSSLLTNSVSLSYRQRITSKIQVNLGFNYRNTTYEGLLISPAHPEEREDDSYQARFSLEYRFKKWLRALAGYRYVKRDSNDPLYDYDSNEIFAGLTVSF